MLEGCRAWRGPEYHLQVSETTNILVLETNVWLEFQTNPVEAFGALETGSPLREASTQECCTYCRYIQSKAEMQFNTMRPLYTFPVFGEEMCTIY